MEVFSYKDYIKAIHTFRLNAVMKLAEGSDEYSTIKEKTNDKIVKNILKNTKEMSDFLNHFINLNNKISLDQLILYKKNKPKLKDSQILYKLKDQEVFFLVYYLKSIELNFPYKLLNLCIDIIQEWSKNKKRKEIVKYPKVIPIVIYAGKEKWNLPAKINTKKLEETTYEENRINLSYNLIDINKITIKELSNINTMMAKSLLIEKLKKGKNN